MEASGSARLGNCFLTLRTLKPDEKGAVLHQMHLVTDNSYESAASSVGVSFHHRDLGIGSMSERDSHSLPRTSPDHQTNSPHSQETPSFPAETPTFPTELRGLSVRLQLPQRQQQTQCSINKFIGERLCFLSTACP